MVEGDSGAIQDNNNNINNNNNKRKKKKNNYEYDYNCEYEYDSNNNNSNSRRRASSSSRRTSRSTRRSNSTSVSPRKRNNNNNNNNNNRNLLPIRRKTSESSSSSSSSSESSSAPSDNHNKNKERTRARQSIRSPTAEEQQQEQYRDLTTPVYNNRTTPITTTTAAAAALPPPPPITHSFVEDNSSSTTTTTTTADTTSSNEENNNQDQNTHHHQHQRGRRLSDKRLKHKTTTTTKSTLSTNNSTMPPPARGSKHHHHHHHQQPSHQNGGGNNNAAGGSNGGTSNHGVVSSNGTSNNNNNNSNNNMPVIDDNNNANNNYDRHHHHHHHMYNDNNYNSSSIIQDEEVKVNLAMADLMAYLQVVANNSTNLPLTRRDDPEVTKTVSILTSDEYARKSAAFVPADVRVIAGSFAKYGRVWDLPTADEYQASDGAQEPGVSYGGACANAMLKVLYDAANEQMEEGMGDQNDLFDDDDDEEQEDSRPPALLASKHNTTSSGGRGTNKNNKISGTHKTASSDPGDMPPIEFSRQRTFQSLILDDGSKNLTWADLLRKMKAEIQEIGYAQAPGLTTTRKFDMHQPFGLVPPDFDPSKNQKRSLLIGCNYSNIHGAELKASHDDVRSMKDYIINVHGFPESKGLMTVLMDDEDHKHPTHLNITESLKALSEQSRPGDAVFIHFAGHGGRVLDHPEADSYDEVWCPSDYMQSGLIRDTLIFKTLLAPMRYGVTVTMLIDCCDTGMMLDLPYSWSTKNDRHESSNAKLTLNDDFSFVRFLKVVKTLYEASTFTQLGKSVGTALKHQAPTDLEEDGTAFASTTMDEYDEDTTLDDTATKDLTRSTAASRKQKQKQKHTPSSILSALQLCTSPEVGDDDDDAYHRRSNGGNGSNGRRRNNGSGNNNGSSNTAVKPQPSLLEKVMACTLGGGGDDDSDEDTYMREFDQDPSTTFESMTDDGSASYTTGRRQ